MKYEFTITLKPQMYRYSAKEQFDKTRQYLNDKFVGYCVSCVAELTQDHNVHYHAMIELKDMTMKDKFLNQFRGSATWGRKTCTQIVHERKWEEYLKKDITKTREVLGYPIVCDNFEILEKPIYIPCK